MQPDTSAIPGSALQALRHAGPGGRPLLPALRPILTLGRHGDYFTFFGLHRRLQVDPRDLEQRFRALSRQFHPDYFHNATATERLASLERSSYLNDAFRTLRDPVARLEYLLKLEGFAPKEARESSAQVPPGCSKRCSSSTRSSRPSRTCGRRAAPADQVAARLDAARTPIEDNLAEHERQLAALMATHDAQFDAGDAAGRHATLEALRTLLLERTYLTNLLATVRREMSGGEAARA